MARIAERARASTIPDATNKMGRFIQTYERRLLLDRANATVAMIQRRTQQGLVNLLNSYSQSVLLARRISGEQQAEVHRVERVLRLRLAAGPPRAVLEALPIFYRRVFLSLPGADPAYWVGGTEELARAAEAVQLHREHHTPGALLVSGPPGSGMTAICERVMRAHFHSRQTFHVRPPDAGSSSADLLGKSIQRALGTSDTPEKALLALPADSVVTLPDLERWFERRHGGLEAIDRLGQLIDSHGDRVLFLLSCNEYTFQLFRRLGRLDDQLMATVQCQPLDAASLRQAVMVRHESSGLALRLANQPLKLGEWSLARLFSRLFHYSGGWLGPAMQAWIGHIVSVTDDTVTMRNPRPLDLHPLDGLDKSWVALLIELALHRRIAADRLARVVGTTEIELAREIQTLQRAGLVVENSDRSLQIDPFVAHHIHLWLRKREVL
jgi:hypothetical protein